MLKMIFSGILSLTFLQAFFLLNSTFFLLNSTFAADPIPGLNAESETPALLETFSLDPAVEARKVVPRIDEIARRSAVPETDLTGWKFQWDPEQTPYVEYFFSKPIELKPFASAIVRAKFWCPPGCPARNICMRFRDADGEILQFQKDARFSKGGVFELEWPVQPDGAAGSWGCEKLNRVIDMPAKLHSMTVSYRTDFAVGFLYLLDLTVETVPLLPEGNAESVSGSSDVFVAPVSLIEATRLVCPMDDSSQFSKLWGAADFVFGDGVLRFDETGSRVGVLERKFAVQRFPKMPEKLIFETELLKGESSIQAVFCYADKADADAHKDFFETQPVPIPAGRGKTVIDLTETLKKAEFPVRLSRFDLVRKGQTPASLRIFGIEVVERQTPAEAVDFEVLTDTPVHVLTVGNEKDLKFRFTNRAARGGDFQFDLEYENYAGEKKTERLEATLAAGETKDLTPRWRPDSLGHWEIRAKICSKAQPGAFAVKSRSLAWLRPSGPTQGKAPGFLFSVCTHTERWSQGDRRNEVEAAALCGVKVVRLGCGWAGVEPEKGGWKWETLDQLVELYAQKGIEPQVILGTTPKWAVPEKIQQDSNRIFWKNFPENVEDWKHYVREVGKHFRGKIRFYEIWNEPDLTGFSEMTLEQYAELQKTACEAMAEVDPGAIILSGGFATLSRHSGLIYPEFQRDFLLAAKGSFHVHAIHEHGWFDGYRKRIDELFLPLRKETGTTVPWYSNETAMTSVGGFEKKQAQTLFKKLLFAWVRGSIGYTWYDLRNDGYDPRYGEHHFGMVTNDFYPKSVYSAFNALTANYAAMKEAKDFSPDPAVCLYRFANEKEILFGVWTETALEETRHFVIRTDAKAAKLVDLMGNEKPIEIQNSLIVLEVGPEPQTLKLDDCSVGEPLGELIHVEANPELVPGRRWGLPLKLFNPLGQEAEFEISVPAVSPSLKFETKTRTVRLPSGVSVPGTSDSGVSDSGVSDSGVSASSQTICLNAEVGPEFRRLSILPIFWKLKGSNWSGILYVPLKPAFWAAETFQETPNFTLNRSEQLTPLTPADPSNTHRLWQGPADLSAKIWVAGNLDAVQLRVEVEDDQESLAKEEAALTAVKPAGDQLRILLQPEGQKNFTELRLAKLASGQVAAKIVTENGTEIVTENSSETPLPEGSVKISRTGTQTLYEISVPWSVLNFTGSQLTEKGVRLDFLSGDDDGEGLDSWLHFTKRHPDAETLKESPLLLWQDPQK